MDINLSFEVEDRPKRITSILNIEQELEALRRKEIKDYHIPGHWLTFYDVMVPVGYKPKHFTVDYYDNGLPLPKDLLQLTETHSVRVHGHRRGVACGSAHLCHVLGFNPTGMEHPYFINRWRQKWNGFYNANQGS